MRRRCFQKNLRSRSRSLSAVAVVALSRRWRIADLVHAVGVVKQDFAVFFVPAGRDRMVGNNTEMLARMKKSTARWSRAFEKRPVVDGSIGDGNESEVGPRFPYVCNF